MYSDHRKSVKHLFIEPNDPILHVAHNGAHTLLLTYILKLLFFLTDPKRILWLICLMGFSLSTFFTRVIIH